MAGAVSIFPCATRAADAQQPTADTPPGWSAHDGPEGLRYFVPPGATNMDVYEAVFPRQQLSGTLEETTSGIWHGIVGSERIVDSKTTRINVNDGAPAYEVAVASVDSQNRAVYRVFIVKLYGRTVAAGELRFNDVDHMKSIGEPAYASLENMVLQAP
ncbi:MAG TPA: hypothetical protein VKT72_05250 [Candidatus Baltobacteraceae bacterium]|nr:hypothetical protein [Candidatus Baltobacteraceae bacterium]